MHEVLVNRLGGLSLPRKSVVRLNDCPYMTLDICRGSKTTTQQQASVLRCFNWSTGELSSGEKKKHTDLLYVYLTLHKSQTSNSLLKYNFVNISFYCTAFKIKFIHVHFLSNKMVFTFSMFASFWTLTPVFSWKIFSVSSYSSALTLYHNWEERSID